MSPLADPFQLTTPANDGLPVLEPLCEEQAATAKACADLLADLARKIASCTNELDMVGLRVLRARMQQDAPWAVSEVRKTHPTKLRRQRYISGDVFDRWTKVQNQPKPRLGDLCKDCDGQTLIHEHVVQRKGLVAALNAASDAEQIAEVLARVTACVVSKAEDARLRQVRDADGWARYALADPPIRVYDRRSGIWLTLPPPV